ncbi:hypothetical protein [Parasitella parasitica]|uniref:Uncharacterized protein n=1 Tax=Parasitella parasitica TaxID=35722 RepID=A0A0B7NQ37_9FUNG|nr:hypothetical protein [Parasitella parasitica]
MAQSNCLILDESRREHPPPKKMSLSRTGTPITTEPSTLQAAVAQLNERNYQSQQESTREHLSAQSSSSTQRAPFTVKCSFNKDLNDFLGGTQVSAIQAAFDDAKSNSFNESFNYCRRLLRCKQLATDKEHSTLVDIMNGVIENHCFISDTQGRKHYWFTRTYLQKTRWYKLYLDAKIPIPLPISLPPQDAIVATGKPPAAQLSSRRIGPDYDALIEDTVRQQSTATAKFTQSLSTISYPHRRSATLLETMIYARKKCKNPFSIALLVDELITAEEKNDAAETKEKSIADDVEEKVTGDEAEQDSGDGQPQEEEVGKVKEYRVVSKTLKGIIKESFDYQLLLQRMEGLQYSCHKAIRGFQFTATAQYFDYSSVDLHHRGIGADTSRIAVLGDTDQNALHLFEFYGVYRILCSVVGRKKSKIKNPKVHIHIISIVLF